MKLLRRVLLGVAGLLALLVSLVLIAAATLDPNLLKPALTRQLLASKQRMLTMDGDIRLALWPDIGLEVGRLTISEPHSNSVFLALERAHLSLAILPLLQGQITVRGVEAAGLSVRILRRSDGSLSIADLLGPNAHPGTVEFHIDKLRFDHIRLVFDDRLSGHISQLDDLDLTTGAVSRISMSGIVLHGHLLNDMPHVDDQFDLAGDARFDAAAGTLALSDLRVNGRGDVPVLGRAVLALRAELGLNFTSRRYDIRELHLDGKGDWQARQLGLLLDVLHADLGRDTYVIDGLSLTTTLTGSGEDAAFLLRLPRLAGTPTRLQGGPLTVSGQLKRADGLLAFEAGGPIAIDATDQSLSFPAITLNGSLSADRLPGGRRTFNALGAFMWSPQSSAGQLQGLFDQSSFRMKLEARATGGIHADRFDVAIGRLDLGRYARRAGSPSSSPGASFDPATLRLPGVPVNIHIDTLVGADAELRGVDIDLKPGIGQTAP